MPALCSVTGASILRPKGLTVAEIVDRYLEEIRNQLQPYWATWSPSTHLALGDCGTIEDGVFTREANVRHFDVEFSENPNPVIGGWVHKSSGAMTVTIQAKVDAQKIEGVPQGKAGIEIRFSREHAVVFLAPSGNETTIDNIHLLKQQLVEKALEGSLQERFPDDFAVVTHVVTADAATVLISEDRDGKFVATAEADFKAGLESLADASIDFSVASEHKVRTALNAEKAATPLFRGFRLKRNGWGELVAGTLESPAPEDRLPFVDLGTDA
jgi:hypothetical protein